MNQNKFMRYEQKYLLNKEQFTLIQEVLNKNFIKDKFYKSCISNLYLDNDHFDLITRSIDKPLYKEKVRLRSYDHNLTFLEIKQKYKGIVFKRRIALTKKELNNYLESNTLLLNNQIMNEINYRIKFYDLKPKIFVSYDRISYILKENINLRLTIDSNLKYRFINLNLSNNLDDKYYFEDDKYIMEIKCENSLPLWLVSFLNKNKIYPQPFSKVGHIYQKERGLLC